SAASGSRMGEVLGGACAIAEQSPCPCYPGGDNGVAHLDSIKPFAGVDGLPIVASEQRKVIAIVQPYRIVGCHVIESIEPIPRLDHHAPDLNAAIAVLAARPRISACQLDDTAR